jgi:hypothetical protein
MMTLRNRKLEAPLRLALPLVWLLAALPAIAFDAIYDFGVSLTDTGNKPALGTNYFQGRYSNGPLWIEYLSNLRPSLAYTLQSSVGLASWTNVTTINATNSVGQWPQSLGADLQGFFRLSR